MGPRQPRNQGARCGQIMHVRGWAAQGKALWAALRSVEAWRELLDASQCPARGEFPRRYQAKRQRDHSNCMCAASGVRVLPASAPVRGPKASGRQRIYQPFRPKPCRKAGQERERVLKRAVSKRSPALDSASGVHKPPRVSDPAGSLGPELRRPPRRPAGQVHALVASLARRRAGSIRCLRCAAGAPPRDGRSRCLRACEGGRVCVREPRLRPRCWLRAGGTTAGPSNYIDSAKGHCERGRVGGLPSAVLSWRRQLPIGRPQRTWRVRLQVTLNLRKKTHAQADLYSVHAVRRTTGPPAAVAPWSADRPRSRGYQSAPNQSGLLGADWVFSCPSSPAAKLAIDRANAYQRHHPIGGWAQESGNKRLARRTSVAAAKFGIAQASVNASAAARSSCLGA